MKVNQVVIFTNMYKRSQARPWILSPVHLMIASAMIQAFGSSSNYVSLEMEC